MPKNPSLLKIAQTANKAGYVDVKLGDYLRTKTGFKEGQKVGVSLKFLKDKNGRVMPELTLSADKNGNTVVLKRGKPTLPIEAYIAELFQDAVIYSAQLTAGKARIRRLVPNNDNFEPVIKEKNFKPQACQEEFRVLPDFLKSITEDRGASARFKMLASTAGEPPRQAMSATRPNSWLKQYCKPCRSKNLILMLAPCIAPADSIMRGLKERQSQTGDQLQKSFSIQKK